MKEKFKLSPVYLMRVINVRNMQGIDELVSEDVISHEVTVIGRDPGLEGFRRENKLFLDAFPEAVISAEDIIA